MFFESDNRGEKMVNLNKVLKMHEENTGVLDIQADFDITSRGDLAEAYTPGVSELAKLIAKDELAKNKYTMSGKLVAVISDGTAVLGLGNIGPAAGLPIVEGKSLIYKNFSGVDAVPMAIDQVPVNELVATVRNISKSFAGIHLEDISAPRCFEIEEQLKKELNIPVYHDDQTGTAIVTLAGLINATKVVGKNVKNLKILMNGVGASGLATAKLLLHYGIENLTLVDIYGKVTANDERYNSYQREFSGQVRQAEGQTLDELIENQDVFIGLSEANVLSAEQVQKMATQPIIFALANPVPEILPEIANAAVMATGSSQYPNQVNNVLVFPGLFKGLLETGLTSVSYDLQIKVAESLSNLTETPTAEKIITGVFDKGVVESVSGAVKSYAQKN